MRFEFATASRIVFGPGASVDLPRIVAEFGTRALVVTGRNMDRAAPMVEAFALNGIRCSVFPISGEPTLEAVRNGVNAAANCDVIIGFGGGSPMDGAKAVAALVTNSGDPLDYLEVVGRGKSLEKDPLPFIAVPTTAGTGAEVTRNAVIGSPEDGVKASLRSAHMLAKVAVIDPHLTLNLPPDVTASTGLDTLTQLIEPYVSVRANAMTDLFCTEGLKRVAWSLRRVYHDGQDRQARESMSFASLLSGLALANAGLGVVHGLAGPLGGMLGAPHGALCAAVLPYGCEMNIRALRDRAPEHGALERFREVARVLTGDSQAEPENGTEWVRHLCEDLRIEPLRSYGLRPDQFSSVVSKAQKASSMKSNPVTLTPDELTEVLERAL